MVTKEDINRIYRPKSFICRLLQGFLDWFHRNVWAFRFTFPNCSWVPPQDGMLMPGDWEDIIRHEEAMRDLEAHIDQMAEEEAAMSRYEHSQEVG